MVNLKRIINNLEELSKIGKNEKGGIDRAFSDETEIQAREYIKNYWSNKLKLQVNTDAAGNIWGARAGNNECSPIVFGSHHDAVKNGGAYDGALGVILATEIMEVLIENNIETNRPYKIVSFTGEEPNQFGVSTMGSKLLTGRLKSSDLFKLKGAQTGEYLSEALNKVGGNADFVESQMLNPDDIYAFVECHIEQGKRLSQKNLPLSGVSMITGIYREKIAFVGEANHGGTTIMKDRKDALLAASEFNLLLERILIEGNSDELTGTVGQLNVLPNSINIIPNEVEVIAEIRTPYREVLEKILVELKKGLNDIASHRGVKVVREIMLDQKPINMDKKVQDAILKGIEETGEEAISLVSMAGHDAANIQRIVPAGMLFVRTPNGKSHCLEEMVEMSDVKMAAEAMLNTLLIIDKEE